ncbi:MAG: RdgB/HAM1 family non-canonical purine NTP pyrophosphatase [Gammaproteobacteria bacterium]|nr:RdgB/HAM1 family non-canonical purine NTP pyrophosphatase [Gammaproteobacteria bacterium]MYF67743.1 RdgB/HAM1 family non-canonical purine NTP pyrophosphatase [Gammaproteobacteria bacterium]MYK37974.1 RdgB/HAM1 family non-canonical purine NTP pyrophosphatase [Gammaproteobacteria bacterium]
MSTIRSAVLASGNAGKLRELRELLKGQIRLIDMRELALVAAEETGSSFEENARLKAFAAARQSGMPALSDDSGLEVDALAGAPGIYSSRYAGDEGNARANIRKLLEDLEGVPVGNRTARFRCVLVLAAPDNEHAPLIAEGVWEGRIAEREEGRGGFGYDPVFLDGRTGQCAALMSAGEKGRRSHRGRAARKLARLLGLQGAGAG